MLVGLNMYTGAVELSQDVDPPGASTPNLLQRTGLNLDHGSVVFGYGGNSGDCEPYHGWVVSVPEAGGAPAFYDTTGQQQNGQPSPNGTQGAVWQGGAAPEVDDAGNVWAASGNGSADSPYDGSDSVFELSSSLALLQLFAPSNWSFQNASDQDMSAAPALMSDGLALEAAKSHTGYLLSQSNLGGIGGQVAVLRRCARTPRWTAATLCSAPSSTSPAGTASRRSRPARRSRCSGRQAPARIHLRSTPAALSG